MNFPTCLGCDHCKSHVSRQETHAQQQGSGRAAHCCLSASLPRISFTSRAPCRGGLEYMGRAIACRHTQLVPRIPSSPAEQQCLQPPVTCACSQAYLKKGSHLILDFATLSPSALPVLMVNTQMKYQAVSTFKGSSLLHLHLGLDSLGLVRAVGDDGEAADALTVQAHVFGIGLRAAHEVAVLQKHPDCLGVPCAVPAGKALQWSGPH